MENKQLQWLNESRSIYFIDKNSTMIPDTPRCGFNNIKCPEKSTDRSFILVHRELQIPFSSDSDLGLDHHQSFINHRSSPHCWFCSLSVRKFFFDLNERFFFVFLHFQTREVRSRTESDAMVNQVGRTDDSNVVAQWRCDTVVQQTFSFTKGNNSLFRSLCSSSPLIERFHLRIYL